MQLPFKPQRLLEIERGWGGVHLLQKLHDDVEAFRCISGCSGILSYSLFTLTVDYNVTM